MLNTPDWSSENQLTSCGSTPNWLAGIHVCGIPALNPIFSQEWMLPMGDFAHIFPNWVLKVQFQVSKVLHGMNDKFSYM
jgi:hypothetical protein